MTDIRPVAVVTGAAGGIGRAMLAEMAARGYRLIAVDLPGTDLDAALTGLGAGHLHHPCDQGDEAQILALWRWIDGNAGPVRALLNNAAIGPTMTPTVATATADFARVLRINTLGAFAMSREAARRMAPGGAILQTASLGGLQSNPCRNAYYASKAAVISMVKSLACEWAGRGIRINAIAPGYVRTPMVAALEAEGKLDLAAIRALVPMGRLARPDEMASVAGWFVSDEARYATGACLVVDGGWACFNQAGVAGPSDGIPADELTAPPVRSGPRVVVVTGAARGNGLAIATRFAAEGDHVVMIDRNLPDASALPAAPGARHLAMQADITDEAAVTAAFARVGDVFGQVDVLVNNAAVGDVFRPALEQDFADLAGVLDVNLTAAFACARETLRLMAGCRGVIVNIGSINTFLPFAPRHAYGASKAGLDMLSRCLAAELGPMGHRTATLAPGYIRTPGTSDLEAANRIDTTAIRARIPMGAMGLPDDIAAAVHFLASPAASFVNGGILYVDGGWTAFGNAGAASTPDQQEEQS